MKKHTLQRIFATLSICLLGLFALPVFAEGTNNTTMSNIDETANTESISAAATDTITKSDIESVTEATVELITEADAEAVTKTNATDDMEMVTETDTTSEQLTIVSITDISYTMGYAIPAGTDWEEFFAAYFSDEVWLLSVPCETADGDTIYADVTWYDPEPNTSATGSISLTGTLVLPDNTTLAESARTFRVHCYVSIQAEGTPTLDSWYIADGAIHLPWVSGGVENMNAVVLYQQDESGCWSECDSFYCDSEAVHLDLNCLTYGAVYSIQVVWDEGSTNIFSFTYTGTVSTTNNIGGDRDGGDSSGNSLSGVRQTAPESSEAANSSDTSGSAGTSGSSDASDSSDASSSADASASSDTSGSSDASSSSDASDSADTSGSSDASGSADASNSDASGSSDASNSDASGSSNASGCTNDSDSSKDSNSFTTSSSTTQKSSQELSDSTDVSNLQSESNSKSSSGSQVSSDSQSSSDSQTASKSQTDNGTDTASDSYSESNTETSKSNFDADTDNTYSNSIDSDGFDNSNSDNEPFMETVTDTYTLISGTRLNLMRQTGSVRFSKQGITVTLDTAALDPLDITSDSRFYIEIRKTENGFSLIVELDGQPVTDLPDTIVMLPYSSANSGHIFTLKDEYGQTASGNYDAESGILTFTIQHTGTYTVITTLSASVAESDTDENLMPDSDASGESDAAISAIASDNDSNHHFGQPTLRVFGIAFTVLFLIAAALIIVRHINKSRHYSHSGWETAIHREY